MCVSFSMTDSGLCICHLFLWSNLNFFCNYYYYYHYYYYYYYYYFTLLGVFLENFRKSKIIAAQNYAIRTNRVKAKVDKTQQISRCRLCGDRKERINHIINECSKLALKENKTRTDSVEKVINWELCKRFTFDQMNGICTTLNPSGRMKRTKFSGILRYKRIN